MGKGWGSKGKKHYHHTERPGEGRSVNPASYCEESSSRGGATASGGVVVGGRGGGGHGGKRQEETGHK